MRIRALAWLITLLCCALSCTGPSQTRPEPGLPPGLAEAALPPVAALDGTALCRSASSSNVSIGGWFGDSNCTPNAVQAGTSIQLPSGPHELAAAWYGVSVDYNGAGPLPYLAPYELTVHGDGSGSYYILLADYVRQIWVPLPGLYGDADTTVPVTLTSNAGNLSGSFWFAILTYGGEAVQVDTIDLAYPDGPVPGDPVDYNQYIAARDGTGLATDIYLPYPETSPLIPDPPYPVVLMRTPYVKSVVSLDTIRTLTQLNVVVVLQYFRGRLNDSGAWPDSFGTETLFRDHAGPDHFDALDTVAWIEGRPWYNGTLVMAGTSALGLWIYQANPQLGRRLAGIFPQASSGNVASWAALSNGCFRQSNVEGWLGDNGFPPELITEARANAGNEAYWAPLDFDSQAAGAAAPGVHETGWWDVSVESTIASWRALYEHGGAGAEGNQWLLIGPWSHGTMRGSIVGEMTFPTSADEVNPTVIPDSWNGLYFGLARLGRNPFYTAPSSHVRAYWMGEEGSTAAPHNHWYELPAWPPAYTGQAYYLSYSTEGQLLASLPPHHTQDFQSDPANPVATLGGANLSNSLLASAGPYDQTPVESHADILKFRSSTLPGTISIGGPVVLTLFVSTDAADTDLMVKLIDEDPLGKQWLVADNALRLDWYVKRNLNPAGVEPGTVYEVTFELGQRAYVFGAGHKLGLDIQGTNSPRFAVNPGNGDDFYTGANGVVQHNTLNLGITTASQLVLPLYDPSA